MAYFRQEKAKVRIARIFNTYGKRMRADGAHARALPRFLDQALSNKPITIYGDGRQTRSLAYVIDTLTGILGIASTEGLDGEVFNIGNPEEITIVQLAETIIKKTRSRSDLKFLPSAQDDPRRRCPDISKAKKLLGYSPKIDLESGLDRLIPQWVMESAKMPAQHASSSTN
jgi:nucleoside-diphosphate-sugar epimerase